MVVEATCEDSVGNRDCLGYKDIVHLKVQAESRAGGFSVEAGSCLGFLFW